MIASNPLITMVLLLSFLAFILVVYLIVIYTAYIICGNAALRADYHLFLNESIEIFLVNPTLYMQQRNLTYENNDDANLFFIVRYSCIMYY